MAATLPNPVKVQLDQLHAELTELETSHHWQNSDAADGSRQLKSIALRIEFSSKKLKLLVREECF